MPRQKASNRNLRKRKKSVQDGYGSDSDFENNSSKDHFTKIQRRTSKEVKSKYFESNGAETSSVSVRKPLQIHSSSQHLSTHKNIVHYLYNTKKCDVINCYRETFQSVIVKDLSEFSVHRATSPFPRRVTCMTWHPTLSHVLAVGSKNGDIFLWDIKDEHNELIAGSGPDGSIKALKFDVLNPTRVYTASINGTVGLQDFLGQDSKVFLEIDNYREYFSALDVSIPNRAIVSGDTKGNVSLLNLEGKLMWNSRLHKQKVTHIEFSSRESWVLATASLDRTVKMWDIRNMKNGCIEVLSHEKPVNSAYFSLKDGVRLLTTDQHSQLRVYRGPLWSLEKVIPHPHRQFQHLTSIKAHWNPLEDIIVVGRYPDPSSKNSSGEDIRSIDFIDAETGKLLHQLSQIGVTGIVSLNTFNHLGDRLASGMGMNILIWCNKAIEEKRKRTRQVTGDLFPDKKHKRLQRTCNKKNLDKLKS